MGIYLRGKVYWARWDEDGKQRRRSLDTKDRGDAESRYEDLTTKATSLAMREVLSRWIKHQTARCKPRSIHLYQIVRKRLSLVWGDLRPDQITTLVVEEFQEKSLAVGLSPRTINHQIGIALSALKWAHDRGLIDTEPPKWKRLKVKGTHSRKYLTTSELEKLLTTVREPRWQRLESFVMLALYAGRFRGRQARRVGQTLGHVGPSALHVVRAYGKPRHSAKVSPASSAGR